MHALPRLARRALPLLALALPLALAPAAHAASLLELINGPASIFVSDENGEQFIDVNGNNIIDEGDIFQGVLAFDQFIRNNEPQQQLLHASGNSELTGVFSVVVTGKTPRNQVFFPGEFTFTFGVDPLFEAQFGAGAAVALFEDAGISHFNVNGPGSAADSVQSVVDGTPFFVIGFASDDNGWIATGFDVVTGVINPADRLGESLFALSRTSNTGTGGTLALGLLSNFAGTGEFVGTSQIGGPLPGSPWQFSSETSAEFVVIPTPSAGLAGAALLALLLARRR